ncbi:MAG: hypothetical protein JRJ87_03425 [Deltaproteobacteria bacterium]|nr:hypothetical protein [Deltaproteobacteria bacterium]
MNAVRISNYSRVIRLVLLVGIAGLFSAVPRAQARVIEVMPSTNHSALTLTTDESYGFQVLPGKPLKLDLVGPGTLTLTVRLNSKSKRSVFSGRFEMKRGRRRIKKSSLKLHRSRVGAYKEESSLNPSLPKVFKIKVRRGVQSYTFSLRAPRGTSMTLRISYDTKADQSKAQKEDDALALVPLIAPTTKDDSDGGAPALVPLVAVVEKPKKPVKVAVTKPVTKKPEKKPVKKVAVVEKPPKIEKVEKPPKEKVKPIKEKPAEKVAKTTAGGGGVRTITTKPVEPPVVEKPVPSTSAPVVSLGVKFGQISPLQKVGGTTFTGSLDMRYILPVFDGRLTLGVEAGYYKYEMSVNNLGRQISLMVIPIAVQLFYRIPINTFIEPYVGLGGDVFICFGENKSTDSEHDYTSGQATVFGGHLVAGLEAEIGPGFILAEVRAGISFGNPGVWDNNPSISGLLAVAGYRFVF